MKIQLPACDQTAVAYYKIYSGNDSEDPGEVAQEIYSCTSHSAEVLRQIGLGIFTACAVDPDEGYHCGDGAPLVTRYAVVKHRADGLTLIIEVLPDETEALEWAETFAENEYDPKVTYTVEPRQWW